MGESGGQGAGHIGTTTRARDPSQSDGGSKLRNRGALVLLRQADAPLRPRRSPSPCSSPAAGRRPAARASLWATVNVCDTPAHPDKIGVRGVDAGPRDARRACTCASASSISATATGEWHDRAATAPTRAGSKVATRPARARTTSGWTFSFEPPAVGGAHMLRGVVDVPVAPRRHGRAPAPSRSPRPGTGSTAGRRPGGLQRRDLRDRLTAAHRRRRTGAGRW